MQGNRLSGESSPVKFGAAIPVMNEWRFLPAVAGQLLKVADRCVVLRGERSLSGAEAPTLTPVPELDPRIEVVSGAWQSEHETRNAGMEILSDCDYVFTLDSDEICSERSLRLLADRCSGGDRAVFGKFQTYWKTPHYRIDPPESIIAPLVVRRDVRFERLRMFSGEHVLVNLPLVYHLSYVRTDEEMQEKLRLFGHASEVVPDWFASVWKRWDGNQGLEDLHPTHPPAFKRAVKVRDTELLYILSSYGVK